MAAAPDFAGPSARFEEHVVERELRLDPQGGQPPTTQTSRPTGKPPHIRGPLEIERPRCETLRGGFDSVVKLCDYGAYARQNRLPEATHYFSIRWTQIAIKPRDGWCLTKAEGIEGTEQGRIISAYPIGRVPKGRHRAVVGLADGDSGLGRMTAYHDLSTGRLRGHVLSNSDGDLLRWRWQGAATPKTVHMLVATGTSVPASDDGLSVSFSFLGYETRTCRNG